MERSEQSGTATESDSQGEEGGTAVSVVVALALVAVFVAAGITAIPWPASVRQFPIAIVVAGGAFSIVILIREARALARMVSGGGLPAIPASTANCLMLPKSLEFFGFLVGLILVMPWIGQKLALPLFVAAYLLWWSDFGWRTAIVYTLATWAILIVFYEKVLHIFWYPAAVSSWLTSTLPVWLPSWLFV